MVQLMPGDSRILLDVDPQIINEQLFLRVQQWITFDRDSPYVLQPDPEVAARVSNMLTFPPLRLGQSLNTDRPQTSVHISPATPIKAIPDSLRST